MVLFYPRKSFEITNGTSAGSTAKEIVIEPDINQPKYIQDTTIRIAPRDTDVVVKLGDVSVVASNAITDSAFVDGNFVVRKGSIELFRRKYTQTHISIQSLDGATTGKTDVTVGTGI